MTGQDLVTRMRSSYQSWRRIRLLGIMASVSAAMVYLSTAALFALAAIGMPVDILSMAAALVAGMVMGAIGIKRPWKDARKRDLWGQYALDVLATISNAAGRERRDLRLRLVIVTTAASSESGSDTQLEAIRHAFAMAGPETAPLLIAYCQLIAAAQGWRPSRPQRRTKKQQRNDEGTAI